MKPFSRALQKHAKGFFQSIRQCNGDCTPYFDDVMLDKMINEWFEEQALAPAA